jgi:hypothetical protein
MHIQEMMQCLLAKMDANTKTMQEDMKTNQGELKTLSHR